MPSGVGWAELLRGSGKYLQRYLSEFCYRFNRRFDLAGLVTQLILTATRTPPLPYRLAMRNAGNQEWDCPGWYGRQEVAMTQLSPMKTTTGFLPRRLLV